MKITITDDFSLSKIANSGQVFRVAELPDGLYRFISGRQVLYIKQIADNTYQVNCRKETWNNYWAHYFDLNRSYKDIRASIPPCDEFMYHAAEAGAGVRILKQDPWEMLITFIISQRKSIPAIKTSVEALCERFGTPIQTKYETFYTFPTPKELAKATDGDLKACGLGYRIPYVKDALFSVLGGHVDLAELATYSDDHLLLALKGIKGVGDKVANCIALFGYGRTAMVPVDVWILRIMDTYYGGKNPFIVYGDAAGIMQQYAFWYMINKEE